MFAKRPEPGQVKTRLVPYLGAARAAELAAAMLDDTVAKCTALAREDARASGDEGEHEVVLCVAPDDALAWFSARYTHVDRVTGRVVDRVVDRVVLQCGADLGARLAHHTRTVTTRGDTSLVVVGTDAPHASPDAIRDAHLRLAAGADLVLGLDDGGGYHLVGLRAPCDEIFTRVEMSTPDMAARTLELARVAALSVALVERTFDVDEPADVERLARLLTRHDGSQAALRARCPRTAQFFDREFPLSASRA